MGGSDYPGILEWWKSSRTTDFTRLKTSKLITVAVSGPTQHKTVVRCHKLRIPMTRQKRLKHLTSKALISSLLSESHLLGTLCLDSVTARNEWWKSLKPFVETLPWLKDDLPLTATSLWRGSCPLGFAIACVVNWWNYGSQWSSAPLSSQGYVYFAFPTKEEQGVGCF